MGITIKDDGYSVKGQIMVRNEGSMTHGITSPLFKETIVNREGDGAEISGPKGKGFRAYHVETGKTMTLIFKKESRQIRRQGSARQAKSHFDAIYIRTWRESS